MSWTPQQSSLLSLLLDDVMGTDRITVVIINMCNYRSVMPWTRQQSSLLSLLLDEVVGTQEMINMRQDFCRLYDCIRSNHSGNRYFTGSKAEGLDLPGSDEDYAGYGYKISN